MKKTLFALSLTMLTALPAVAGNAAPMAPAAGDYKQVSTLVPLPEFIPGLGSLFVDPTTLPAGPFAAYDRTGKLVSTIYMIPIADMQNEKAFNGLAVAGDNVHSVDMYYNAGHPGVDVPHYHVTVWHVDPQSADLN
ncbi:MAG: hypothetical protein JKY32_02850 [Rhizobiales bacterium]|nr:hypothetical protein [Hyphomicrobiales bacterium]